MTALLSLKWAFSQNTHRSSLPLLLHPSWAPPPPRTHSLVLSPEGRLALHYTGVVLHARHGAPCIPIPPPSPTHLSLASEGAWYSMTLAWFSMRVLCSR